jgi:hypothetical protein
MLKKSLCDTCANGRGCVLPQKFPVWECEEFNNCVVAIEERQDKAVRPRKGLR